MSSQLDSGDGDRVVVLERSSTAEIRSRTTAGTKALSAAETAAQHRGLCRHSSILVEIALLSSNARPQQNSAAEPLQKQGIRPPQTQPHNKEVRVITAQFW